MSEVKRKWHTVGLPLAVFRRVKAVIKYTGNTSVSEYVRFATQEALKNDEPYMFEQKEMEQEIKERLA